MSFRQRPSLPNPTPSPPQPRGPMESIGRMIILNLTGLSRVYWLPSLDHQNDHHGLWYWEMRFLGVEVIVYSKAMGTEFIRRLNRSTKMA